MNTRLSQRNKQSYLQHRHREGMQTLRAMNRYHRATLHDTLQQRDRKLGQCQSRTVGEHITASKEEAH